MTIYLRDCSTCPPFDCLNPKPDEKTPGSNFEVGVNGSDACGSYTSTHLVVIVRPTTAGLREVYFDGVPGLNLTDTGVDYFDGVDYWRQYEVDAPAAACAGTTLTALDVAGNTLTRTGALQCIACPNSCQPVGTLDSFVPGIAGDITVQLDWLPGFEPTQVYIEYDDGTGTHVTGYCGAAAATLGFSVCGQTVTAVRVWSEFGGAAYTEFPVC